MQRFLALSSLYIGLTLTSPALGQVPPGTPSAPAPTAPSEPSPAPTSDVATAPAVAPPASVPAPTEGTVSTPPLAEETAPAAPPPVVVPAVPAPKLDVPADIAAEMNAWMAKAPPLPAPTEAELRTQAEAERADTWIQAMERKERERRIGGRWASTIMSAGMATAATVLLAIEEPEAKAARWVLGSSIAPFVAGAALGLFLPEDRAAPWATTALALGMGTAAVSVGLPWYEDQTLTRSEQQAGAFIGAAFATQFITMIPLAFLDRGLGRRSYESYGALSARERPQAAVQLLLRHDQLARAKVATMLLSGIVTLGVVGIGAAITEDPVVIVGAIPALTNMLTIVPMLFRESSLEMFLKGHVLKPGVYRF